MDPKDLSGRKHELMKLIAGLGNPGPAYRLTRHNAGFMFIEYLAEQYRVPLSDRRFNTLTGRGRIGDHPVILSMPLSFMNLSGPSIRVMKEHLGLEPSDIIIVHDDMDLEIGRIKLKQRGGDGGHKGLRSVIEALGDDRFIRLRLGIGKPPDEMDATEYVLSPFTDKELGIIRGTLKRGAQAVETILCEGIMKAMSIYNA